MEIRSSTSATPYTAAVSTPQQPAADNKTATPAESPSTIVTLQQQPATVQETADNNEPSAMKSFAYGVLDLPEPQAGAEASASKPENAYFTAGKWLSAAATVGTIVSLLV